MSKAENINGWILGIPVNGLRTERGILVWDILDGKPLDCWMGLSETLRYGRVEGQTVIEIGGEYIADKKVSVL